MYDIHEETNTKWCWWLLRRGNLHMSLCIWYGKSHLWQRYHTYTRGLPDRYVMLLPIAVLRLVSREVSRVNTCTCPKGCMSACSVGRGPNWFMRVEHRGILANMPSFEWTIFPVKNSDYRYPYGMSQDNGDDFSETCGRKGRTLRFFYR